MSSTSELEHHLARLRHTINTYKTFCDPDARDVVERAVSFAMHRNFGRFVIGTIVIGLHQREALARVVDPVFDLVTVEDIVTIFQLGLTQTTERRLRPTIAGGVQKLMEATRNRAIDQRQLISEKDLVTATFVRQRRDRPTDPTKTQMLYDLAYLRAAAERGI